MIQFDKYTKSIIKNMNWCAPPPRVDREERGEVDHLLSVKIWCSQINDE